MKKTSKKLGLSKQTIRNLGPAPLAGVVGGLQACSTQKSTVPLVCQSEQD